MCWHAGPACCGRHAAPHSLLRGLLPAACCLSARARHCTPCPTPAAAAEPPAAVPGAAADADAAAAASAPSASARCRCWSISTVIGGSLSAMYLTWVP